MRDVFKERSQELSTKAMSAGRIKQCCQNLRVLRFVMIYPADAEHIERATGSTLKIFVLLCNDGDCCKESRQF